ncbi:MAG TPA: DUF4136 domain-containing protein [Bryobacteraceae bacterium]|nr:DUF4136 domain-containing protein [Bryobacteraceae bacterium]
MIPLQVPGWFRASRTAAAVIVIAGFFAALCVGKVKFDYDRQANFSSYKTYKWLPPRILKKSGIDEGDDVVAPFIKAAVNRELNRRGLTEAPDGQIEISAWAFADAVPSVDALLYPGYGVGPGGVPAINIGAAPTTIGRYNKSGTVLVNLIDASTKKSIWGAIGSGDLPKKSQLKDKVDKAVGEMFEKYPIKPTGEK